MVKVATAALISSLLNCSCLLVRRPSSVNSSGSSSSTKSHRFTALLLRRRRRRRASWPSRLLWVMVLLHLRNLFISERGREWEEWWMKQYILKPMASQRELYANSYSVNTFCRRVVNPATASPFLVLLALGINCNSPWPPLFLLLGWIPLIRNKKNEPVTFPFIAPPANEKRIIIIRMKEWLLMYLEEKYPRGTARKFIQDFIPSVDVVLVVEEFLKKPHPHPPTQLSSVTTIGRVRHGVLYGDRQNGEQDNGFLILAPWIHN